MRADLDAAHLRRVAQATYEQLTDLGAAVAVLTPGDATEYRVSIVGTGLLVHDPLHEPPWIGGAEYLVCMSPGGILYPWAAQELHDDYVFMHFFAAPPHRHSAEVLTAFLNALQANFPLPRG